MELKKCTKCEKDKEPTEFRFQNKAKGLRSPWCKQCFSEHEKAKWAASPSRRESNKQRNKERRARNKQVVWDYLKQNPCKCGEANPVLLEFDHRDRDTKVESISNMLRSALAVETLMDEISKCDVMCVVCHRLRTAEQMGWYKDIVK